MLEEVKNSGEEMTVSLEGKLNELTEPAAAYAVEHDGGALVILYREGHMAMGGHGDTAITLHMLAEAERRMVDAALTAAYNAGVEHGERHGAELAESILNAEVESNAESLLGGEAGGKEDE